MKKKTSFLLLSISLLYYSSVNAQLKSSNICPAFIVDIMDGSVNKLYPESPYDEIKTKLPCFNESIDEPSATGCAGVFYKDKGIHFYTYRDYIEINESFKGSLSIPLMGADRGSLFKWFGLPRAKDNAWEAYQVRHGILVVYFNDAGKINKLQISSRTAETLRLCE